MMDKTKVDEILLEMIRPKIEEIEEIFKMQAQFKKHSIKICSNLLRLLDFSLLFIRLSILSHQGIKPRAPLKYFA